MRTSRIALVALLILCSYTLPAAAGPRVPSRDQRPVRASNLDTMRRLDVNDLNLFVTNDGSFAWDLNTGNAGLLYPRGTSKTVVFAAGLWLGAQVEGQTRVTVSEYSPEYGPGVILADGYFDDSEDPAYVVYKVARWTGDPQDTAHVVRTIDADDPARPDPLVHHSWSEYMAGAARYGAPWKLWRLPDPAHPGDSLSVPGPDVRGDLMLWSVYNDADPSRHTNEAGSSPPLDVQVRQTTWGYNRAGVLGRTVFLEYQIIHPSLGPGSAYDVTLQNAYVSLWMDPDLGGAMDDLVGCDTTRALGYCYNGANSDAQYGWAAPALGLVLLQGPRKATPGRIGLTSFHKYISGTDPASAVATYNYMQGLNADGSPLIDPTTGLPTAYSDPGDPVAGTGWLDLTPADKRMMLDSGPFGMAPGDTQTIVAAIVIGQGEERLASVAALREVTDQVRAFFATGVMPPDTIPPLPATVCPRSAGFWAAQCPAGGALTRTQLDSVATRVDGMSRFFAWTGGARAGFCATLAGIADLRRQTKREYATLLANVASGPLGIRDGSGAPIFFSPNVTLTCPALPEHTVSDLLALPDTTAQLRNVFYADDNPAHRRALTGVNFGFGFFNGGADAGYNFLGSTLDPVAMRDSFAPVEVRFSHTATQKAYRFLREEVAGSGIAPPSGRGYLYKGFFDVPFQVWDVKHGVQLDAAFLERCTTDAAGTILPLAQQPASQDSTWDPSADAIGDREYLFVYGRPYGGIPKPALAVDGSLLEGSAPVLYTISARLRDPSDVIDDGDRIVFDWASIPDTSLDGVLAGLETQPLGDPAVSARYAEIAACLSDLNAGQGAGTSCDMAVPVLVSLVSAVADRDEVRLEWLSAAPGLTVTIERNAGDGWAALVTLSADGSGIIRCADRAVVPGTRYGYRLRAPGAAAPLEETWVEVPIELRLALQGLRPNPSTGQAAVSFSLPAKAPATLELIDVAGRRVFAREVGSLGAGSHVLRLEGDRRLPAGLYFIRLTQRGAVVTARGVIVH